MAYEDAEIDNLAKALDLATRSQLEKTDKYIPEEIRHLRRAIEYEGTLDRFRQSDEAGADLPFDDVMAGLGQVRYVSPLSVRVWCCVLGECSRDSLNTRRLSA